MKVLTKNVVTMSTLEIAELTGKRHDNVLADARKMLSELNLSTPEFSGVRKAANGQTYEVLNFPKRETLILVSGYSVELRARIIDRLDELEARVAGAVALPDFSNPAEAARAWADQVEARLLAEKTKAQIGARREATAMNTAAQAVKKAKNLEIELDKSKEYASIKKMESLYKGRKFDWRSLKQLSEHMGLPTRKVFDANYEHGVNSYHADVWRMAYALEII